MWLIWEVPGYLMVNFGGSRIFISRLILEFSGYFTPWLILEVQGNFSMWLI